MYNLYIFKKIYNLNGTIMVLFNYISVYTHVTHSSDHNSKSKFYTCKYYTQIQPKPKKNKNKTIHTSNTNLLYFWLVAHLVQVQSSNSIESLTKKKNVRVILCLLNWPFLSKPRGLESVDVTYFYV